VSANFARYSGFTSPGGNLSSVIVTLALGYTGNMKCAIFSCTSGVLGTGVGAILGTPTAVITNPVTGANTFTFSPPIAIASGVLFYVGFNSDASSAGNSMSVANFTPHSSMGATSSSTYASFPAANPTLSVPNGPNQNVSPVFTTAQNSSAVAEAQQDATTSYVYDTVAGHADLYTVASIASTPATVIAVTTRAYMQKDDAGSRTMAVQIKSGSTTVASPTLVPQVGVWAWAWRMDLTDPNTGSAWTPSAVNAAQIGPTILT
jgi:hypothetical protein